MLAPIGNESSFEPNRLIAAVGGRRVATTPGSAVPPGFLDEASGYEPRSFPEPVGKSSLSPAEQTQLDQLLGVDASAQKVAGTHGANGAASTRAEHRDEPGAGETELSEEDQKRVEEMRQRDQDVRAHEQAHLSAAGPYARGGINLEYEKGPDGRRYAVAGHVNIDLSPVPDDPDATIRKMQVVRQAANAPAQPSSADRAVAAEAAQIEAKARAELFEQQSTGESTEQDAEASVFSVTSGSQPFEPGSFIDVYG